MSPRQPIKLSDLDKSRMKHGRLLINISVKKNSNIPNDLAEIVNFHFSHYKSMGTISCHSNQSSYSTVCQVSALSPIVGLLNGFFKNKITSSSFGRINLVSK